MSDEPGLPRPALEWAARALDIEVGSVEWTALRPGGSPWLLQVEGSAGVERFVLKAHPPDWLPELETELAALRLGEEHRLATPRVLAQDLRGEEAGLLALLLTFLPGDASVPGDPTRARLRAAGAAAARVHSIPLTVRPGLPRRTRHMDWMDFTAERAAGKDKPLAGDGLSMEFLAEAAELVAARTPSSDVEVFLHGDLWQGNLVWDGDDCVGVIDWEAAGAGHHGVDLGALRLDVELMHGPGAAQHVLDGWEAAAGRTAGDVSYWDLVAALNTPADMTPVEPSMAQAGRPDLTGAVMTARRNDFLRSALHTLTIGS